MGSLIELTWGGRDPSLDDGSERTFLEDGDTVVLRGTSGGVSLRRRQRHDRSLIPTAGGSPTVTGVTGAQRCRPPCWDGSTRPDQGGLSASRHRDASAQRRGPDRSHPACVSRRLPGRRRPDPRRARFLHRPHGADRRCPRARRRARAVVRIPQARQGRRDRRDLRAVGRRARRLRRRRLRHARRASCCGWPTRPATPTARSPRAAIPRRCSRPAGRSPARSPARASRAACACSWACRTATRSAGPRSCAATWCATCCRAWPRATCCSTSTCSRRARRRLARRRGADRVDRPGGLAGQRASPTRAVWAPRCCACGCAAACGGRPRIRGGAMVSA